MKINRVSPCNHNYLKIIDSIAKTPEKLYFIGKLPETRVPTVAIVGTRKPTSYGKEVTAKLSHELARRGVVIISGMAMGVDAIAHRACLDANGITIAVLGNGVDIVYPASNQQLYNAILKSGGAIISEYEPGVTARLYTFLERNRIVSGLADAIIITEATIGSGTMSTAARALEQGKEVFVVPGNITSPMSMGCNKLIKQGALPITCAEDVLEVIAPQLLKLQTSLPLGNDENETKIIKLLQSGVRDGEEIQIKSQIDPSLFSSTLTIMEINGIIKHLGANQWTIR